MNQDVETWIMGTRSRDKTMWGLAPFAELGDCPLVCMH